MNDILYAVQSNPIQFHCLSNTFQIQSSAFCSMNSMPNETWLSTTLTAINSVLKIYDTRISVSRLCDIIATYGVYAYFECIFFVKKSIYVFLSFVALCGNRKDNDGLFINTFFVCMYWSRHACAQARRCLIWIATKWKDASTQPDHGRCVCVLRSNSTDTDTDSHNCAYCTSNDCKCKWVIHSSAEIRREQLW